MRLSDFVSSLGMTVFPIVGLIIFFAVFTAVSIRALRIGKDESSRCAALPLDDGDGAAKWEKNHA